MTLLYETMNVKVFLGVFDVAIVSEHTIYLNEAKEQVTNVRLVQ
jgi:hypothetical protein